MYYQDSIIAIQLKENELWKYRYQIQKQYSDSCDTFVKASMLVIKSYKEENEQLRKCYKKQAFWLRIFQATTIGLTTTLIFL